MRRSLPTRAIDVPVGEHWCVVDIYVFGKTAVLRVFRHLLVVEGGKRREKKIKAAPKSGTER